MRDSEATAIRSERTVCPFCSCGCGLYLTGTARGIEGVGPSEHHPVSRGRLCARGWSAHEASLWGPRLTTPLVRHDGELQPASWDDALSAAAAGLKRLREAGRPLGVLTSGRATNEESFLAVALARSALRTPHVDAALRQQWDALVEGLGGVRARPDQGESLGAVERSDLVVLLEDDLALSHPRAALAVLRAVRRGARLITLGWQQTQLATLATKHILLDPTAPLATLAGLRSSSELAELFGSVSRASFVIAPFDADPAVLHEAAALLAELAVAPPGGVHPETILLPLPVRANSRGSRDMGVTPTSLPGWRALKNVDARTRLRRVWGIDACWDEGLDAESIPAAVAGLVVLAEDVSAVLASPAPVRERLAMLDHLVVIDAFLTETASFAHVVLPMAAFGEAEGTLTGVEDRAQVVQAFAPHLPGVRQGWDILAELTHALGSPFRPGTLAELRGAIAATVPGYESLGGPQLEDGWPVTWPEVELLSRSGGAPRRPAKSPRPRGSRAGSAPRLLLRRTGAFDWGQDPLVRFSPTLRRDTVSQGRRYPHGVVAMSTADASAVGVREGSMLRLRTVDGEARVAVTVRAGLQPGMLLAPYVFREQLGAVLGADGLAEVEVQPA